MANFHRTVAICAAVLMLCQWVPGARAAEEETTPTPRPTATPTVITIEIDAGKMEQQQAEEEAEQAEALADANDPKVFSDEMVASMLEVLPAVFIPDVEVPMPEAGEILGWKQPYNLYGKVIANDPITSVSVRFYNDDEENRMYPYEAGITLDPESGVTEYYLESKENIEGKKLDNVADFTRLRLGAHRMQILVTTTTTEEPFRVFEASFTVEKMNTYPITANKFNGNYLETFEFFGGDTSKFMFNYRIRTNGYIGTDDTWRENSLVESTEFGRVHTQALPYFEKATEYLNNTYVRVSGTNGDSGVLLLNELIEKAYTYVPRFVNGSRYISHHTLGTSVDVNDNMYPNTNSMTTKLLLAEELGNFVTYNGIQKDENGVSYYDYTYSGSYKGKYKKVPKTMINYLLYELAFYRAGFGWGFYYRTTSDGMHFTLTDCPQWRHEDPEFGGLRMVFAYADSEKNITLPAEPLVTPVATPWVSPTPSPVPTPDPNQSPEPTTSAVPETSPAAGTPSPTPDATSGATKDD